MKPEYTIWQSVMNDSQSRPRSRSLFWETRVISREERLEPVFTLKDKAHTVPSIDKKSLTTYPSLKVIYMSYDHVPGHEYEFAMDVFGSWQHWVVLCASTIKATIQEWRDELSIKLKSEAIRKIVDASRQDSTAGVNAARYLADEGYVPKKAGRITKEEKLRQVKMAAGVRDDLQGDMDRLGLTIINGTK